MDNLSLMQDLIVDEAMRLKPYRDSVGKLTIGVGRNLDDVGISGEEALYLLSNDIARAIADLDRHLPWWWRSLAEPRQRALVNLCFNMGIARLLTFKKMLGALQSGDYARAVIELHDSRWAKQVGQGRAGRISALLG